MMHSRFTVSLVLFLGGLAWGPTPVQADESRAFLVGACTHFSQGKGDLPANLAALRHAGILSLRDEVGWSALEREPGRFRMPESYDRYVHAARDAGIEPLLVLDYANPFYDDGDRPRSPEALEAFCRYAEFVVGHFGSAVRLYEVWNEWDIGIGLPERHRQGGSAEDYVRLLEKAYPRIKGVNPEVVVMAGACTSGGVRKGWLEDVVRRGALRHCDAISIHSYNYSAPFPERSPEACADWMMGVQAMLARYHNGQPVPFYVTEMGWPTHTGKNGTAPELAAAYLARLYLLARTSPSFLGLWWYDFQDDGWNPEDNENNFGLARPDLTPKPAYHALAAVSGLVAHGRFIDRLATPDPNLWILRFRHLDRDTWAVWSGDDQERQVLLRRPTTAAAPPLQLEQVGHPAQLRRWGQRLWADRELAQETGERLSLVVGPLPVLVRGDLDGAEVDQVVSRARDRKGGL